MLNQREAVLFDLDGTLMDSMWLWEDIDIEFLGRYHLTVPEDLETAIEGMSFTETAQYFKDRFALPCSIGYIKEEWNRMAFQKYAEEVPLKPGAKQFLYRLKQLNIRTAIASSNSHELIDACLLHNGVKDLFDCIAITCEVEKGKPAPDIYLYTAEKLGADPARCLVFEDIPNGILAGKRAGMQVCAVEDAYSADRRDEIRQLADYYIRSYDEIADGSYEVLS